MTGTTGDTVFLRKVYQTGHFSGYMKYFAAAII
jgi:hypothetical protein